MAEKAPDPVAGARRRPKGRTAASVDLRAGAAALGTFPAFAEPVSRLTALLDTTPIPTAAAVVAVEGDVALTLAVLRVANGQPGPRAGRVDSVVQAVVSLPAAGLTEAVAQLTVIDYFERLPSWDALPERMRRHAAATARAADRLAVHTGYADRDRLVTAALLHDVGSLVFAVADPERFAALGDGHDADRAGRERAAFGIDHAAAGAGALRAAGLPETLAGVVEAHDHDEVTGDAAYVHAADLLAHEALGQEVGPDRLL